MTAPTATIPAPPGWRAVVYDDGYELRPLIGWAVIAHDDESGYNDGSYGYPLALTPKGRVSSYGVVRILAPEERLSAVGADDDDVLFMAFTIDRLSLPLDMPSDEVWAKAVADNAFEQDDLDPGSRNAVIAAAKDLYRLRHEAS
jgi:hypothetical protein